LKTHGAANIGRSRYIANAKKPALPAIGSALGVSGLCRGGVGFGHQRSGSWCNDLMWVVRGKSRLPRVCGINRSITQIRCASPSWLAPAPLCSVWPPKPGPVTGCWLWGTSPPETGG
jgi:hypothetical protein